MSVTTKKLNKPVNTDERISTNPESERSQQLTQIIEVEAGDIWTDEIDELRRKCFPGEYPTGTSKDEFDDRSTHFLVRVGVALAAYARITPGPSSVFETWTKGQAQVPVGAGVADIGRLAVAPGNRGLGLLRLITSGSALVAAQAGYEHLVGAVVPDEPFRHVFFEAGYEPTGPVVEEIEPSGDTFQVQPIMCTPSKASIDYWRSELDRVRERVRDRGYELSGI